jgi:hypothetical protein
MLSSGLTLIFSMMGVLNFAHASFYMLGAYFAFQTSQVIGFWPALIVAPIAVAALGAITERYGLRTVHKYGHVAELLFTFGLAYIIEEIVHLIWGRAPVEYKIPEVLDFSAFSIFSTQYPAYRVFMMLVSVGMLIALYLLLTRTRIGLIIQASLTHPDMVESLGHNVPRVFMTVFAGGPGRAGRRDRWQCLRDGAGHGRERRHHRIRRRRFRRHGLARWRLRRLAHHRGRADLLRRVRLLPAEPVRHPGDRDKRRLRLARPLEGHHFPGRPGPSLHPDGPDAHLPAEGPDGHA